MQAHVRCCEVPAISALASIGPWRVRVDHTWNTSEVKESVMTKKLSFDRPNRRDFLRTGISGDRIGCRSVRGAQRTAVQDEYLDRASGALTDDAFQRALGFVYLTDKTDGICSQNTLGGFRFTDVTVPNSASITAASVSLTSTSRKICCRTSAAPFTWRPRTTQRHSTPKKAGSSRCPQPYIREASMMIPPLRDG